MTSQVRTGSPDEGLASLWKLLVQQQFHHVPIVEKGRPVGMISSRDLVRMTRERGVQKLSEEVLDSITAGEVMSRDLETIDYDAPVDVAIDRIGRGDIHALVVLDEGGNLVGIVTNNDLLNYMIS